MAFPTDVIVFSTADWSERNWTNNQRVSQSLAEAGFRVLYLESLGLRQPRASKRDLQRIWRRLSKVGQGVRQVEPNLWVFSPLVIPMHHVPVVQWINQKIVVTTVQLLSRWLGFHCPILWAYNPVISAFQSQLNSSLLIYHCVDDLTTVPGISPSVVKTAEAEILQAADLVFVTSLGLNEKLSAVVPDKVHYLPNVADYQHFSQARKVGAVPDDLAAIAQPRIGFIGEIKDYKLDFELISTLAQRHPDWHWVFVGAIALTTDHLANGQMLPPELQLPNLHFLGYRPYKELPNYLRGFDVAVLPCLLNDYTKSMFPMKFFEYLAAGTPVVGTRLPSLSEYESVYS
ncbi:MAG: glycosyltransferase, partial [Phormidesmis sp.]